jgi:hypothetical protein
VVSCAEPEIYVVASEMQTECKFGIRNSSKYVVSNVHCVILHFVDRASC